MVSQSPAEIAEEVLPQVAWVDRWDATATALQPQVSSTQSTFQVW